MRYLLGMLIALGGSQAFADDAGDLLSRADLALKSGDSAKAVQLADQVIAAEPKNAAAYDLRGTAHFKLAKIKESLADFDRAIELEPKRAASHWRRGLTLYYANDFKKGVAQFTTSDREEPNDVENAVWHFLCNARVKGVDNARGEMLKIQEDPRGKYFMKIHAMFLGKAKPEDVLAEAEGKDLTPALQKEQRFYANYYVGMYYESVGEAKKSLEYLQQAVEKFPIGHYMMDVAKVHLKLRTAKP